MKFQPPLASARLVKRYKRFLADVVLDDGGPITCAVPNTGSMMGLTDPGSRVWLSKSDNPKRKLAYTFELIQTAGGLVGVNTGHPNAIVEEAIKSGAISELAGYASLRREVRYGENSRIDLYLEDPGKGICYAEVKNVHLKRDDGPNPGAAEFPDAVTKRGAKHLVELGDMVAGGARAVMLYLVQRGDCDRLKLCRDLDPAYCAAFDRAASAGVEAIAIRCQITQNEIIPEKTIPVEE